MAEVKGLGEVEVLAEGVLEADRTAVGQAITLVESTCLGDRPRAERLLDALMPHTGKAHRIGVTGAGGVGKSTLIEALGSHIIEAEQRVAAEGRAAKAGQVAAAGQPAGAGERAAERGRVAVVAIDPSSSVSGGSILGDKTRMTKLAANPKAFVRPAPAAGMGGGVAQSTRETILVLEAAGFDIVIIETVGTGQSDLAVHGLVDTLVLLMLAGAGDELQGFKRGVLELADLVAVSKADGANAQLAAVAAAQLRGALELLFAGSSEGRVPPVLACSAMTREGVADLWLEILDHARANSESGERERRREDQRLSWMRQLIGEKLVGLAEADPKFLARRADLEGAVQKGLISPRSAVDMLFDRSGFGGSH